MSNERLSTPDDLDKFIQSAIIKSVSSKRNVKYLNRTFLESELKKYWSSTPFEEFTTILGNIILNSQFIPENLREFFQKLKAISVNSAEGDVYLGNLMHLEKLIIIKTNKYSKDPRISWNAKHEFVVGTLLNSFRNEIPNFMYTYTTLSCNATMNPQKGSTLGLCEKSENSKPVNHTILEYVEGKIFESVILNLSLEEIGKIMLSIFCALDSVNSKIGFCHNDLHLKNIIIREEIRPVSLKYTLSNGRKVIVNTKYVPVIIDYGFSRCVFNGVTYTKPGAEDMDDGESFIQNTPYLDIHKLFGHSLAKFRMSSNYNRVLQKFFLDFFNSIKSKMDPRDYEKISYCIQMDARAVLPNEVKVYPSDHQNYPTLYSANGGVRTLEGFVDSLRMAYSYPYFKNVEHITYMDAISNLLKFEDKMPISSFPPIDKKAFYSMLYSEKRQACNGENSPTLDKYGLQRSMFDCAKYFFDGVLSVAEFPKGLTVYHGSTILTQSNSEFPIGKNFYQGPKITDEVDYYNLRENKDNQKIDEILKRIQKIDLSHYGDISIAKVYSSQGGCGKKCIQAYRLKKDAVFLNLTNPETLQRIFRTFPTEHKFLFLLYHGFKLTLDPRIFNNVQPNEIFNFRNTSRISQVLEMIKTSPSNHPIFTYLGKYFEGWEENIIDSNDDSFQSLSIYGISDHYDPIRRFKTKSQLDVITMRDPNYIVPKLILKYCEENGYAGYCRQPSRKGARERFGEIVLGVGVKEYLERNYSDPNDWQHNDDRYLFGEIGKLIRDMKNYKTTNIDFHAGNLLEHSIWASLYAQEQFRTGEYPVVALSREIANTPEILEKETFKADIRKVIIASSFLHDIGKGGDFVFRFYDKPDHPQNGIKPEYVTKDTGEIKLANILTEMGISPKFFNTAIFLIRWHWDIGELFKAYDKSQRLPPQAIDKMYARFLSFVSDKPRHTHKILFLALYIVWSSDLMASQPFIATNKFEELKNKNNREEDVSKFYLNAFLEDFPYITNLPKVQAGSDKYAIFNVKSRSVDFINDMLQKFN